MDIQQVSFSNVNTLTLSTEEKIKAEAMRLGFSACGIAVADRVPEEEYEKVELWLKQNMHGSMSYLERNAHLRRDPRALVEGTQSLIVVAMNYYPKQFQSQDQPQFAYYAYGKDYHKVVKKRLQALLDYIRVEIDGSVQGRCFADSAPILERYWAVQAGLGWRGKNGLLIIPGAGSFFVLGTLLVSLKLEPDQVQPNRCGSCTRCLDHCPTKALIGAGVMDARRCISYLTIEQQDEIPSEIAPLLGNQIYGCDICQKVCPWNRYSQASGITEFMMSDTIKTISAKQIEEMKEEEFALFFAGSPIKRAGLKGLKRTLRAIDQEN